MDEGLNSVFGHIFTTNYSKIKTGFYFAFSSLTLRVFLRQMETQLFASPFCFAFCFLEVFFLELFELKSYFRMDIFSLP